MRASLTCAALTFAAVRFAAAASGQTLTGAGDEVCATWTGDRHAADSAPGTVPAEQWVLGFLSGIGYMHLGELDPLHGMRAGQVRDWVDAYCAAHPREAIHHAATAFIEAHPR